MSEGHHVLKSGFSFKPRKIRDEEDKQRAIEEEKQRLRELEADKIKRKEEEKRKKEEEKLKKQAAPKRRAVDFFSSSSSESEDSPERDTQYDQQQIQDEEALRKKAEKRRIKEEKKKLKREKRRLKRKQQESALTKIDDQQLDYFYDAVQERERLKQPEGKLPKFLYKHELNSHCLPISVISFPDKSIVKYGLYGREGETPGYSFLDYAMILGFKRDQESIGLFEDINKDMGKLVSKSKKKLLQKMERNNIRYYDPKFNEKNEDQESNSSSNSSINGFHLRKQLKRDNNGWSSLQNDDDFMSFEEIDSANKITNVFQLTESLKQQHQTTLSIRDYSELRDLKVSTEELTSEEIKLFHQNKQFHAKIKENPSDPFIWIDYIKIQEQGIKYSTNNTFSKAAIMQKKIGIIEKALEQEELKNNQILILYHMRVLQDSNSGEDFYKVLNEKWMGYIQKNIFNLLLWNNFLDFRYSNLLKFSATYFRESAAQLLGQLTKMVSQSKQVDEIMTIRRIILLILRKVSFIEEQMGFKERSFGMLQALIEMNVFCPTQFKRILNQKEKQEIFKKFWEDYYACRTGEILSGGWEAQEANATATKEVKETKLKQSFIGKFDGFSELLVEMNEQNWIKQEKMIDEAIWRPANPVFDKELIKYSEDSIVFCEDIEPFLVGSLGDPESQITLINILFENMGLPPVNDNIFLSTENKAFSTFYADKARDLLHFMSDEGNSKTNKSTNFSAPLDNQYCGIDQLDYLNKFFGFDDAGVFAFRNPQRRRKLLAQLEYARRLLYELQKKLDRESILIYLMWIEGLGFIAKAFPSAEAIISEKQAKKNIRTLLQQNENVISLWVIYAEMVSAKAQGGDNQGQGEDVFAQVDAIFEKLLAASVKPKQRMTALYFWSCYYLRQAGKTETTFIKTRILEILQLFQPFSNIKNLILQLNLQLKQQIAKEKSKLDVSLIPKMKTKVQKVFPLSKKSILAYFLVLAQSLESGSQNNYQDSADFLNYVELIEETNEEKIKLWDDAELYARLQRKFQNEMQLLTLNILRVSRLSRFIEQDPNNISIFTDCSTRDLYWKQSQYALYTKILQKYPFFSIAVVELVKFNISETTRIDRLVVLRETLNSSSLFYSFWLLIIFNEIAAAALSPDTTNKDALLCRLRFYFSEASKDYRLLEKQIALLDKFRTQAVGIDSTTDYFNQISFLSLFNTFTALFEPSKLANRSLQSLQEAPFSKEAYLYRIQGLEGEEAQQKVREIIYEKEIRIIYPHII